MGKARQFKRLRKIEQLFPAETIQVTQRMSGAEMLEKFPGAKDHMGKPVDPKKIYIVKVDQPKSHYREMKKVYSAGGIPAVNNYINTTADSHEHAQTATAEINSGLQDRTAAMKPVGF